MSTEPTNAELAMVDGERDNVGVNVVNVLANRRIALGISGGIAAYKACELVSQLVQLGAHVDVIMTENAQRFVGAATFQALTKRPVHITVFEEWTDSSIGHVSLAQEIEVLVVAPAT